MKFKFKRNYDYFFIYELVLLIISLVLGFLVQKGTFGVPFDTFKWILLLILINFSLLTLIYLLMTNRDFSMDRKGILVKFFLRGNLLISYDIVEKIVLDEDSKTFFFLGKSPTIKITYNDKKGKKKVFNLRTDKPDLMYNVLVNEYNIHNKISNK